MSELINRYGWKGSKISGLTCYVPTKAHPERGQTLRFLLGSAFEERFKVVIVVNDHEAIYRLDKQGLYSPHRTHLVLGIKSNIQATGRVRDAIAEHAGYGKWYLGIDDNIIEWLTCSPEYYNLPEEKIDFALEPETAREIFSVKMCPAQVAAAMSDLIVKCEERGTNYGGFAQRENPFHRPRKWANGCVRTKGFVHCPDGRPFMLDPVCGCLEDATKSWDTIAQYGLALCNNWILPRHKFFQVGGIGSRDERRDALRAACAWMVERWPGLLKVVDAVGEEAFNVNLRVHGKGLRNWRMKYLDEHPDEGQVHVPTFIDPFE